MCLWRKAPGAVSRYPPRERSVDFRSVCTDHGVPALSETRLMPSPSGSSDLISPALAVEGLSHDFGGPPVLTDVSFSVPRGGFCALLGANGAGKTTLISLITRLYACRTGRIEVLGSDLSRNPGAALAQLGVVFQERSLDLDLSVMQNLRYQGTLHGMSTATIHARAEEELERIGLLDKAETKLRALSGGQMRRVEIARALLHQPEMLLLDEPTVGLDPPTREQIHQHMLSLRDQGVAILWCTHLLDEVVPDDQLVILDEGEVLEDDIASKVRTRAGAKTIAAAFAELTGTSSSALTEGGC